MKALKDILFGSLGIVGYVIWFILSVWVSYAPLIFLDFSFVVDVLIILAVTMLPFVGCVVEFVLWVWSFVVVLAEPIDGWSIFYFITFAFYFVTTPLTYVINLITMLINRNRYTMR